MRSFSAGPTSVSWHSTGSALLQVLAQQPSCCRTRCWRPSQKHHKSRDGACHSAVLLAIIDSQLIVVASCPKRITIEIRAQRLNLLRCTSLNMQQCQLEWAGMPPDWSQLLLYRHRAYRPRSWRARTRCPSRTPLGQGLGAIPPSSTPCLPCACAAFTTQSTCSFGERPILAALRAPNFPASVAGEGSPWTSESQYTITDIQSDERHRKQAAG